MMEYIIIIIVILLIFLYVKNDVENFTNDEAIQNVASLYNSSMATVTNLKATGNVTVDGGLTAGNYVYTKGNATGGTHFPWTDGNNYITSNNNILRGGPTTVQGDLNVSGGISAGNYLHTDSVNVTGNTNIGSLTTHGTATMNADINSNATTNLKGNVNIGGKTKFRTMNGIRIEDGWSSYSQGGVPNINECANICMTKNDALGALYLRSNGTCWCKQTTRLYGGSQPDYDTVLFI